jgi:alanyl-tRNA synthetase
MTPVWYVMTGATVRRIRAASRADAVAQAREQEDREMESADTLLSLFAPDITAFEILGQPREVLVRQINELRDEWADDEEQHPLDMTDEQIADVLIHWAEHPEED